MQVVKNIEQLGALISEQKEQNKTIGFIPTMGALHQGHISLVKQAEQECDYIVVSIFVNPTQFNDPSDLEKYPRTLDADLALLETTQCNLVFTPSVETIYPEKDTRVFNFGLLETVMEGAFRPGHFNGVAQVVSKLFYATKPHKAFFGQKDFQQLAIIRSMTKQLQLPIDIVSCPIVRETNGLAKSSRNCRLSALQFQEASHIYKQLQWATEQVGKLSPQELKEAVSSRIADNLHLELEYAELADAETLQSINNWSDSATVVLCVAVFCGEVRLIDNIILK